jgi:outer membrane protein assembly factor BamA
MKKLKEIYIVLILVLLIPIKLLAQPSITIEDTSVIKEQNTKLVSIANIEIAGNKKTRIYIIEREIPFKQGEFMLKTELDKKMELCRQQLMNTALFIDVSVSIDKQENELVFIHIQVKERWYFFP